MKLILTCLQMRERDELRVERSVNALLEQAIDGDTFCAWSHGCNSVGRHALSIVGRAEQNGYF